MTTDFERQYYEAESFWAGDAVADPANMRRFSEICDLIPADVRTLVDIGCGNGKFGTLVKERRPDIHFIGVDRSEQALKHVPFENILGEIDALPIDSASVDCVTCLQVVEHLPVPVYEAAMREIARISRQYVIIGVPRDEKIQENTTTCPQCRTIFNVDLHLRSFPERDIPTLIGDDFRHLKTIYPMSKQRRIWVDSALSKLSAFRQGDPGFLSPVCPICGYSEGDRTNLSVLATNAPRTGGGKTAGIGSRVLGFWPTYFEKGYSLAALFERTTP